MFFITEEEISAMRKELDKYGIQMPAFSKIGGILANEVCLLFSLFNHSVKKNTPYSTLNYCCQVKLGISYAKIYKSPAQAQVLSMGRNHKKGFTDFTKKFKGFIKNFHFVLSEYTILTS